MPGERGRPRDPRIEALEPEILTELTIPGMNFSQIAKKFSVSRKVVLRIAKERREEERAELALVPDEDLADISDAERIRLLKRAQATLLHAGFGVRKIEKASLNQVAVAVGILTDKIELLSGRPTQRTSVEEVRKIEELAPKLLEELQRRSLAPPVDLTPREFTEVPS